MSRALRDHVRQAYRISTKSQQADSVNIVTARVLTYGHFHKIIILGSQIHCSCTSGARLQKAEIWNTSCIFVRYEVF